VIWHFLEVWILMLLAFAVGGAIGALLYDYLARSQLATAQGVVADAIGDVVDGIKARLGVGPVWRPEYRRVAGRAILAEDGELDPEAFELPPAKPQKQIAETSPPLLAAPPPERAETVGDAERESSWRTPDDRQQAADDYLAEEIDEDVVAAAPASVEGVVPMRPAGLSSPRNGVPDNLQRIRGVGERNEELLNSLGIFHFGQIAAWTPGEVRWVGAYLAFPERIERDDWVGQATILASGGDTGFVKAADRRRARRQRDQFEEEVEEAPTEDAAPDDR
jgi:predicted flap endonuclease-1-like 5' DNA nuclease